jgi:prolyl 4-hydroxylase
METIGRKPPWLSKLEDSANAGQGSAQLELARLYLTGQGVRRDLSRSRAYFGMAAASGERVAAETYRAFIANGTGGASDWQAGVQLLRVDQNGTDARQQLSLIQAMDLDCNGHGSDRFATEMLSQDPRILCFPSFFSEQEADYLIGCTADRFRPSFVVHPVTGAQLADPVRSSFTAAFPLALEQPAIHALNLRIAVASGSAVGAGEPLTILRYSTGQQYRPHLDTLPNADNQRAFTMLVYLNDAYTGGETHFPALKLTVKGRKGDALLISNLREDGEPDPRLVHEGRPVFSGIKYVASRWIRQTTLSL